MQSLDMDGLDRLDRSWTNLIKYFPQLKINTLKSAGEALLLEVRRQAMTSGMRDGGAKVAGWQRKYLGRKGGYVAIRAAGGRDGGGVGADSAGAVTNYTENGHRVRGPSRRHGPGYRRRKSRAHTDEVAGYHYYRRVIAEADRVVREPVETLKREIAARLGGESA
jgi:hypothetical protein